MNIALWIVAGLLASVLFVGGLSKLAMPKEKLAEFHAGRWVRTFDARAVKALGVIDLLAAVGLILPGVLDIAPVLVPVAAVGTMLLMVGAVITRLWSNLAPTIVPDLAYLGMAAFVAWGRFGPEPF